MSLPAPPVRVRALTVTGLRSSNSAALILSAGPDLTTFALDTGGSAQQLTVGLSGATRDGAVERRYPDVLVDGSHPSEFRVQDWHVLGPDSLQPG